MPAVVRQLTASNPSLQTLVLHTWSSESKPGKSAKSPPNPLLSICSLVLTNLRVLDWALGNPEHLWKEEVAAIEGLTSLRHLSSLTLRMPAYGVALPATPALIR